MNFFVDSNEVIGILIASDIGFNTGEPKINWYGSRDNNLLVQCNPDNVTSDGYLLGQRIQTNSIEGNFNFTVSSTEDLAFAAYLLPVNETSNFMFLLLGLSILVLF